MEHFYNQIYGWSHYLEPWYKHVVSTLPKNPKVVEVGCWHGRSTACLAVELINHQQTFNLWAVDHWLGCKEPFYHQNGVKNQLQQDLPYQTFLENMNPVIDRIKIIRDTSMNAAEQFDDNSLDLVILDDEHSEEGVLNSILAWWPKIKTDGIICGDDHDSHYAGVINAVRKVYGRADDSYCVYTIQGWGNSINDHGVWSVSKTQHVNINQIEKPEDPWSYKLSLAGDQPELGSEPEPIVESKLVEEEQIIPTSTLQNPKIRSII